VRVPHRVVIALAISASAFVAACTSPEATRLRGGGPGADPRNRSTVVFMHEGSRPYHGTPRVIEPYGLRDVEPARQADALSLRERPAAR
jgi:hypothetical protein